MKIAAFIDDGLKSEEFYRSYLQSIRTETKADAVAAIMAGDILHSGFLSAESKEVRSRRLASAGTDLVIESPVHGVILKPDTYAYVMAMLMQKLGCIHTLFLPCQKGDKAVLEQAAQLMLLAPREYQQALRQLRPGRELYEIIPMAVDRFVPGALDAMSNPMNRFAVEVKNAMRLSYCPTKAMFCEVDFDSGPEEISKETDEKLGTLLQSRLQQWTDADLMDIFGSNDSLIALLRASDAETFTGLAKALVRRDHSILSSRQFLLRALLDFRHITHSNCALFSYITSIRVLQSSNTKAFAELVERAGTTVLGSNEELSTTESKAKELYQQLYG